MNPRCTDLKPYGVAAVSIAAALIAATVLVASTVARAEGHEVAVFYTPPSAILLDMEAELKAGGFLPVLIAERGELIPLSKAAAEARTDAAVRILPSDREIAVFVADPSKRMFLSTNITIQETEGRKGAVSAIKAVETIRVGLMQIREEALPNQQAPPPVSKETKTVEKPLPSADERNNGGFIFLSAAPAVTFGFGNIPPSLHIALNIAVRLTPRLRLFVFGLAPTFASTVDSAEGSASIREGLVTLGLSANVLSDRRCVVPYIGLQGGLLFMTVKGLARLPLHGEEPNGVAGVIVGQLGTTVRLLRILFLRAYLLIGAAFLEPVIRFDGEKVASFGRPFISGAVGIEIQLW
jgi:hypothetical protein